MDIAPHLFTTEPDLTRSRPAPSGRKPSPMPPSKPTPDPFMSIDADQLENVAGGATRVTARSSGADDQLTQMLTTITDSIKQLATNNNQSDPMQMMLMMMMMGG